MRAVPHGRGGVGKVSEVSEKLTVSVAEAAELLGVSRDMINDLIRKGELRSFKLGSRRLISRQAMEEFISSRENAA